jgi:hypothetical protein
MAGNPNKPVNPTEKHRLSHWCLYEPELYLIGSDGFNGAACPGEILQIIWYGN